MARKALIEIVGNAASYLRSGRQVAGATATMRSDLNKLSVTAKSTADATIRASIQKDARLRAEIRTYREIASAAEKGSREQVTAANAADAAERRLSRTLSVTAAESRALARSGGSHVRSIGTEAHGSSGKIRGLATSAALLGSSVFAGGSIAFGIKDVVEASIEARDQQEQLAVAVKDAGLSFKAQKSNIDGALASQRQLGFSQVDSVSALALEVRGTKSVTTARQALTLADNIARGRHIALATAANAVARAYGGQTGALRRLVPFIDKNATATEAIAQAQKAYSGAAVGYSRSAAGAQDRLSASLKRTEVIIGDELQPTITHLAGRLASWLNNSRNQARVQRDVASAVHTLTAAAKIMVSVIHGVTPIVRGVNRALGGTHRSIVVLAAVMAAFKVSKIVDGLTATEGSAKAARTEVSLLRGQLGLLAKIGTIVVVVEIIEHRKTIANWLDKNNFLGARTVDKFVADHGGKGVLDAVYGDKFVSSEIGEASSAEKRQFKRAQMPGGKFQKGTRFADEGGGKVLVFAPSGQKLGELSTSTQAGKVAQIFSYYGLKAGQRATDQKTEAALEAKLLEAGYRLRRNYPIVGQKPSAPRTGVHSTSTSRSTTPDTDAQLKANALDLAGAKTDATKLTALIDERRLLGVKMAALRKQIAGATGVNRDLLVGDLTKLTTKDTSAFRAIEAIHKRETAATAAAARKAATAARAAATAYRQGIDTEATQLKASADSSSTVSTTRKSFGKLIAFYKREAQDAHLTRLERARYAKLAIDERKAMIRDIAKDRKAEAAALESKQLGALGVGKGSSISQLLDRLKQDAEDKQSGIKPTGLGTPSVRALKTEADQVAKALKGTYLDTSESRNVITRIRKLLGGSMGALNADMRGKIRTLLQGLKGDLSTGVDGFNLAAADKHRRFLDRRYADQYGKRQGKAGAHLMLPPGLRGFGTATAAAKVQPLQVHYHYEPHLQVIANEPIGHALDRGFFKMRNAMGGGR